MLARTSFLAIIATLAATSSAFATLVGTADLIDPAIVHSGTVGIGPTLSYVSGGNGATGTADGTSFVSTLSTPAVALAAADHAWAQYDPAIVFLSPAPTNAVIAIPAIDHGWTADNTGEFFEPFEFRVLGCNDTGCEEGTITDVWARGVDDVGPSKNADDWATRWLFSALYTTFEVISGDRLVGGPYSPGEGEIDALALPLVGTPRDGDVPEPSSLVILSLALASLFVFGAMRRSAAL